MATAVEMLLQHGFPQGIVEALRNDGIAELLDHQVEAVVRFDLLGDEDLLVSLPTSCGKTLIGELAGVGAALRGSRAVFSVPLKALAHEKFRSFQKRYSGYGLRIKLATGEFSGHLDSIHRGDYDIAVMIHEKFLHTILREPGFLAGVRVVVLDELQGVEDPSRGPNLEFLLALLKQTPPRRVGLAGVLAPDDPLVRDFGGRVLTTHRRPVDLREGIVLTDNHLAEAALREYGLERPAAVKPGAVSIFRSHNSGLVEAELLPVAPGREGEGWDLLRLAAGLAERGESCLVFLPSRRDAEMAAGILSEGFSFPGSPNTVGLEEVDDERLRICLEKGIGYHHSDCSPKQRAFVERAFREAHIRVLCCTSTLAVGVNLPAHNVLIHPFVWNSNGIPAGMSILRSAVIRNMAGRAGRLGLEETHGRALMVAGSQREWDLYRNQYWVNGVPRLKPSLFQGSLGAPMLKGVAAGCSTVNALRDLFSGTLSAIDGWWSGEELGRSLQDGVNRALGYRFVEMGNPSKSEDLCEDRLELTPLGRVVALRGVSFETGHEFAWWVDRIHGGDPDPLACLLWVCSAAEAQSWNWPRDQAPELRSHWVNCVRERLDWETLQSFGHHWEEKQTVSPRFEDAAKMAWALWEWSEGEPLSAIQEKLSGVSPGGMHAVGEGARWLLETLADVWQVRGHSDSGHEAIRVLSQCTASGLPAKSLAWRVVPPELLDREEKLVLAREIPNPVALLEIEPRDLEHLLSPLRLERIRSFLTDVVGRRTSRSRGRNGGGGKALRNGEGSGRRAVILDCNLVESGSHFTVRTWSQTAQLGMRSAELLLRLVRGRKGSADGGWVSKDDLGVDPESLSQRISDLRRRLGPPPPGCRSWIESDRQGHYRLSCESCQVDWTPEKTPPEIAALMK